MTEGEIEGMKRNEGMKQEIVTRYECREGEIE